MWTVPSGLISWPGQFVTPHLQRTGLCSWSCRLASCWTPLSLQGIRGSKPWDHLGRPFSLAGAPRTANGGEQVEGSVHREKSRVDAHKLTGRETNPRSLSRDPASTKRLAVKNVVLRSSTSSS